MRETISETSNTNSFWHGRRSEKTSLQHSAACLNSVDSLASSEEEEPHVTNSKLECRPAIAHQDVVVKLLQGLSRQPITLGANVLQYVT